MQSYQCYGGVQNIIQTNKPISRLRIEFGVFFVGILLLSHWMMQNAHSQRCICMELYIFPPFYFRLLVNLIFMHWKTLVRPLKRSELNLPRISGCAQLHSCFHSSTHSLKLQYPLVSFPSRTLISVVSLEDSAFFLEAWSPRGSVYGSYIVCRFLQDMRIYLHVLRKNCISGCVGWQSHLGRAMLTSINVENYLNILQFHNSSDKLCYYTTCVDGP